MSYTEEAEGYEAAEQAKDAKLCLVSRPGEVNVMIRTFGEHDRGIFVSRIDLAMPDAQLIVQTLKKYVKLMGD